MTKHPFLYPATPTDVPASITQTSAAFKKEVSGVMGSIVLFLVVYVIMFVLALALAAGCIYAGIALIINIPKIFIILIGVGLIGLGVMVFVFLVKFLFAVNRYDRSGIVEITEEEQPRLFGFIRQVTKDTQTPFPKKIYISPDVNASVFYDSSFWSMFLPVRKNLQIGLGLVNSVNVSEFKAVMAHEFGHFSQRSMKLGSFVYNVNKIIYNMLFDNKSYGRFLQSWASAGSTFAFFAGLTASIAQGIQWVLGKMYGLINKSYMALSREMEFHADAVAASVSGSKSLVTALRRIELADTGYSITLNQCNDLFKEKKVSVNIYNNQRAVLKKLAEEYKLPVQHELPVVNQEFLESNNLSRVNFKNQWASHPSTDDREQHLNKLSVEAEILEDSAWVLFDRKEEIQAELTQKIYEHAILGQEVSAINDKEFEGKLYSDMERYTLPEQYKGFYDKREVTSFTDMGELNGTTTKGFDEIFSVHHAALDKKIKALTGDIDVLKAIDSKQITAKSFDFDGMKYKREDAAGIAEKLELERKEQEDQLKQLDKEAIQFFIDKARKTGREDELKKMYTDYFEQRQKAQEFLKQMNEMLESLSPLYSSATIPIDTINPIVASLKGRHEPVFKGWLKWMLGLNAFSTAEEKQRAEKFIASDYVYFSGTSFFDTELQELNTICNESWDSMNGYLFSKFKKILETQLA